MTLAPDIHELAAEIDAIEVQAPPPLPVPLPPPPPPPDVDKLVDDMYQAVLQGFWPHREVEALLRASLTDSTVEEKVVAKLARDGAPYIVFSALAPAFPGLAPHAASAFMMDCCTPRRGRMFPRGQGRY